MKFKNNTEKMEFVRKKVGTSELYAQLAEESTELAQACLKVRRTMDKSNPTPVTQEDAMFNFFEELSDVILVAETLGFDKMLHDRTGFCHVEGNKKLDRWCGRLQEA